MIIKNIDYYRNGGETVITVAGISPFDFSFFNMKPITAKLIRGSYVYTVQRPYGKNMKKRGVYSIHGGFESYDIDRDHPFIKELKLKVNRYLEYMSNQVNNFNSDDF